MADALKTTRCVTCREEFTEGQINGAQACPNCGDTGNPMAIAQDVTISINWHELRILCLWADNWARTAQGMSDQSRRALASIIRTLMQFRPTSAPALTLFGEISELQNTFPGASLVADDGTEIVPPVSGAKTPH